jgi:hypothetical protein
MDDVVIVYKNNADKITLCFPCHDSGLTIEQIAKKDVPYNVPYKVFPRESLPDFTFSDAFEVDFSNPDGYGANWGVGTTKDVMGWNEDGSPVLRGDA